MHHEHLDSYLLDILTAHTAHSYSLFSMIERTLRQYNLATRYEPNDILFDAYIRSHQALERDRVIRDYRGWIKATCVNIIREKSRQSLRDYPHDPQSPLIDNLPDEDEIAHQQERQQRLQRLWLAFIEFRKQNPFDAKLMEWKFMESLSWEVIQQRLEKQGKSYSLLSLRKRGSRAKKEIRRIYHDMEAEPERTGSR